MVAIDICRDIATGIGNSFNCSQVGGYLRIRTPFAYPDGQVIDLYLSDQGGAVTVTDLGETMRWLESHSWSDKRTEQQEVFARQACNVLGVESFKGMLLVRFSDSISPADAVARLAQAAVRVADISFTFRSQTPATVRDEVEEFLKSKRIPFDRSPEIAGNSGKQWTIDFQTRTAHKTSLVQILSTESRAASARQTEHVVAAWFDLRRQNSPGQPQFVSLFNDTIDVWKPEDFRQVEELSIVALWSNPEAFARQLAA